jgi:hypothetical protein
VIEIGLMVDAIASPVLFEEEEDTGLVELAIDPEDKDKYSSVRPSSAPADLMDRPGRAIRLTARYKSAQWENMNLDERIQADPTYIDRV